ncbi:hypothetical protein [Streptomyces sp. NPDC047000]|uniref:hypothetical protein n=1 Tax=Streptomyces sp. NPDC047000 TaxID=3155474 RepID=UPI0033E33AAD
MTWRRTGSAAHGTRWSRRRSAIRTLRAQGRYGPRLREVLPGFAGVVAVVCGVVAALAVGYRRLGPAVPAAFLVLLTGAAVAAVRHHRPLARRRLGYYSAAELAELDTQGLALAVARILRRDGWRVQPLPDHGRPRLRARDRGGRHLEVVFRPVAEPLPDEEPPHRAGRRRPPGGSLRLVVHRGVFSARDTRWAERQGDTCLVDGPLLQRWAAGTPLRDLTGGR